MCKFANCDTVLWKTLQIIKVLLQICGVLNIHLPKLGHSPHQSFSFKKSKQINSPIFYHANVI